MGAGFEVSKAHAKPSLSVSVSLRVSFCLTSLCVSLCQPAYQYVALTTAAEPRLLPRSLP